MSGRMLTRREIRTREKQWAHRLAHRLATLGVKPNAVSIFSIVSAAAAGFFLVHGQFLAAAFFIQFRLLCNMLDGLLAVEQNLSTKLGDLYNEIPDRLSDAIILVCAGYAVADCYGFTAALGWLAALLAIFTAYIRLLGTSLGTRAYFSGPMAKPHRMFALTVGCFFSEGGIFVALAVIVLGSFITVVRRTNFIAREIMTK